jgi:hypothetical protein
MQKRRTYIPILGAKNFILELGSAMCIINGAKPALIWVNKIKSIGLLCDGEMLLIK